MFLVNLLFDIEDKGWQNQRIHLKADSQLCELSAKNYLTLNVRTNFVLWNFYSLVFLLGKEGLLVERDSMAKVHGRYSFVVIAEIPRKTAS